jgi:hypothetical protein
LSTSCAIIPAFRYDAVTAGSYVGSVRPPMERSIELLEHGRSCEVCRPSMDAWERTADPWITLTLCDHGELHALEAMKSAGVNGADEALIDHARSCRECRAELAVLRDYPGVSIYVENLCVEQRALTFRYWP